MPTFQVLSSSHNHHGKLYKRGDLIETEAELDKQFKNAFQRVTIESDKPPAPKTAEQIAAEAKNPPPPPPKTPGGKRVKPAQVETKGNEIPLAARGIDSISKFPQVLAKSREAGEELGVYERAGAFHVFSGNSLEPLNEKGLKAAEVDDFVKTYLGG